VVRQFIAIPQQINKNALIPRIQIELVLGSFFLETSISNFFSVHLNVVCLQCMVTIFKYNFSNGKYYNFPFSFWFFQFEGF